jgi:hypothetical protein
MKLALIAMVIYWPLFLPVLTFETASVAHKWHLRKRNRSPR